MANHTLFFPHEQGDDLFDLYEDRLFEDKQFFTSKPILSSLFAKRIEKMNKREEAFRGLTNTKSPESPSLLIDWQGANSIPEAYRVMQEVKADIFKEIFASDDIPTLVFWIDQLLAAFSLYVTQMAFPLEFEDEHILLSKEPDPLLFAQSIKSFEAAGGKNLEDLQQLTYNGKETLLNEAKRLSLWRKKELENEKL